MSERPSEIYLRLRKAIEWVSREEKRMSELKPCPFCGGKIEKVIAPMMQTVMFVCRRCGADVCFYGAEYGVKAIKAWNRRASDE